MASGSIVGEIIDAAIEREASWVLIAAHARPLARVGGEAVQLGDKELSQRQLEAEIAALAPRGLKQRLDADGSLDWVFSRGGGRVRGSARKSAGGLSLVVEPMPITPPSLDEIGAPVATAAIVGRAAGIALLAGANRHELTAAMAAHAEASGRFVVSIGREVPLVGGLELGRGGHDLDALGADVVVIADPEGHAETVRALDAAEGALVLVTVPSRSAVGAIERFLREVDGEALVRERAKLAGRFLGAIARRTLPKREGTAVLHDVLPGAPIVAGMVREGRTAELAAMVVAGEHHAQGMDTQLRELLRSGAVAEDIALAAAIDKQAVVG